MKEDKMVNKMNLSLNGALKLGRLKRNVCASVYIYKPHASS